VTKQPYSFDPHLYFSSIWQDAYRLLKAGDANGTRAAERDACLTHLLFLAGIPACIAFSDWAWAAGSGASIKPARSAATGTNALILNRITSRVTQIWLLFAAIGHKSPKGQKCP
jgi:hypothetical protein